jgi:hypothetical protein
MRRALSLLSLLLVAGAACGGGGHLKTLRGHGLSLSLPPGWHGEAAAGQLQAADFPLTKAALGSPELARVPLGHLHLVVWDYGPSVPYLRNFPAASPPLRLRRRDLTSGMEGFPAGDRDAVRSVSLDGELLQLVADLGPKPLLATRLREANRVLASLRVEPPRVLQPQRSRLAADGIGLRLLPGWHGRLEIPADADAARVVLRAHRGQLEVVLLELGPRDGSAAHLDLPVTVTVRDLLGHRQPLIARRVFSTGGRSFDLSVVAPSVAFLRAANRLLATLTVAPHPWTLQSCDLSLRLPGSWRAAIRPRDQCYPVITLHGPAVRVVLTELRPGELAGGRLLRRSGRRFRVEVAPASAHAEADAVLATCARDRASRG